jgi:hypothetical protein
MSRRPDPAPRPDDEIVFRTLAAPGLEEDDLFAARSALPQDGALWGEGAPSTFPPVEPDEPDAEAARRQRHDELLRKWASLTEGPNAR